VDPRQLGAADQRRRRRRVRRLADADPAGPSPSPLGTAATTAEAGDLASEPELAADNSSERGLRGLIGSGTSQVKPTAALRARDAARPRDADLVRSEAELVIFRRNWAPKD
jgi:hypothetical protein